jgi:hypothetical protein
MATTTNYSWSTPDDTALVKDGAAAIRTLGSSVDTTVKALNPETTLGDISYRSSTANTNTRLALGTAGQVLQVNSGATAPEWATPASGGMTLLSTTTLTGASVTIGSIPATYKNLQLIIREYKPATDGRQCCARFNSDSNTRYRFTQMVNSTSATFNTNNFNISLGADNSVSTNLAVLNVYDYANTTTWKMAESRALDVNATTNANVDMAAYFIAYNQTAAISDIVLFPELGNFTSGTAYLYGVK